MWKADGRRLGRVLSAGVAGAALAVASGAAVAGPQLTKPTIPGARAPSESVFVMVELKQAPTAQIYREILDGQKGPNASAMATAAAVHQLKMVRDEQRRFDSTFAQLGLKSAKEIYRLQRTYNGVMLKIGKDELPLLATLPEIKGVRPMTVKRLVNAYSMPFLGIPGIWESLGLHGDGIKVGVIDTGIDYDHVNFGGSGDYTANPDPTVVETDTFPTVRVVGGYDFAGTDYDPEDPDHDEPVPDPDPMDFDGHGTHVAGTVGGYGVDTLGATYAGPWDDEIEMEDLSIGPGVAPMVDLYALKVFKDGEAGTWLDILAVEWATDPNADGNFDDRLDVLNLSLGGDFGTSTEPTQIVYKNAVAAGVAIALAAGNSGDVNFIHSNPASTPEVIAVAAIHDDGPGYQTLHIAAPPSAIADHPVMPADWAPALDDTGISGELALAIDVNGATTGCTDIASDIAGKIAVVDRGVCPFTMKAIYAMFYGATGVVIVNNQPGAPIGMAYTDYGIPVTIPTVMVGQASGMAIKAVMATETVSGTLSNTPMAFTGEPDSIASFSSRGPSRLGSHVLLKPDIATPGAHILSSVARTGNGGEAWGGTSMATPHVAGILALMREGLPTWTPGELKAALMNTAGPDIHVFGNTAAPVSPSRGGAGRANPSAALGATVIAYDADAPEQVSLSFHTLDVVDDTTETRTIRLENKSGTEVAYDVSYRPIVEPPGVTVTVPSSPVTVAANSTADVTVTLAVDAAALVRTPDATVAAAGRFWLSEASGFIEFEPATGQRLRVPTIAALRPASDMAATGSVDTSAAVDGIGSSTITLAGTGLDDDPATTPDPPYAVDSLVWPFELLYRGANDAPAFEAELPPGYDTSETDLADIKSVGINSTVAMGDAVADSMLFFGVETHGVWSTPSELRFEILLKNASAPDWQFVILNYDPNLRDWHDVYVLDFGTGDFFPLGDYLNWFGSGVHTPVFLADSLVFPFPAGWLGLTDQDSVVEFQVGTWTNNLYTAIGYQYADVAPFFRYDLAHPGVSFPGGFVVDDLPNAEIDVNYDMNAAIANKSGGVLLLHHHNANGTRGEIVPVTGMSCVTDDDCPPSLEYRDCDPLTGACVGCADATACLPGEVCDWYARACVTDCRADGANPCAPGGYCDIVTGGCVADCRQETAEPCLAGFYCYELTGQCQVANALINTVTVEEGDENCPNGGLRMDAGLDMNGNGLLDQDEVLSSQYVCNGLETLVVTTDEPAGDNCEWGGQRIDQGIDDNGNGLLEEEEIDETSYACNGPDGFQTLVTVTDEAPGDHCSAGGKRVDVGVDDDRDGQLDTEEIDDTTYLCNAYASLTTSSEIAPGAACENGGTLVQTGLDANGDGELSAREVQSHHVLCHGAPSPATEAEGGGCSVDGSGRSRGSREALASLALLGLALVRRRRRG